MPLSPLITTPGKMPYIFWLAKVFGNVISFGSGQIANQRPQLLFANLMVASLMLNAFYALKQGGLNYSEVYLDILQ